jgi:hypothetical protein
MWYGGRRFRTYVLLLGIFVLFSIVSIASEIVEHGLAVTIPHDWRQLELGPEYNGVAAYCDSGIVEVLIERKPFCSRLRVAELDKQMVSGVVHEKITTMSRFKGRGFHKTGKTPRVDAMGYTLSIQYHHGTTL